jgi:hypothetical protein
MNELRMVLSTGASATRVIAISAGPSGSETLLKARLAAEPSHPRAVQWLLEAVALWQGTMVHAALCAADSPLLRAHPLSHVSVHLKAFRLVGLATQERRAFRL